MRTLALAAALATAAAPAWAGKPLPPSADPFTASGRFDLPRAADGPYAGRLLVGEVRLDPVLADRMNVDANLLTAAVRKAAERSLANFGYAAAPGAANPVVVTVHMQPFVAERREGGLDTVVRLTFKPETTDACLAATAEGRFRALDREKSGGGRRAFAVGATVALAFVLVNAGTFMASEFEQASAENGALNGQRNVAAGEGVSPDFKPAHQVRYAATSAIQLAFADYIRQLGTTPACSSHRTTAALLP